MIGIHIQGEEHHCQEDHHQSNDSVNSCQEKNNQPIEMDVRSNGNSGEICLIALLLYGRGDWTLSAKLGVAQGFVREGASAKNHRLPENGVTDTLCSLFYFE
jgi:hypothetical protein